MVGIDASDHEGGGAARSEGAAGEAVGEDAGGSFQGLAGVAESVGDVAGADGFPAGRLALRFVIPR